MSKINKVTVFLEVLDICETVKFYTSLFDFREVKVDDKLTVLKNDNCNLVIAKVESPKTIMFGFILEDSTSIINKIDNNPKIKYVSPADTAHHEFSILDNSGNQIVLNNTSYKQC